MYFICHFYAQLATYIATLTHILLCIKLKIECVSCLNKLMNFKETGVYFTTFLTPFIYRYNKKSVELF